MGNRELNQSVDFEYVKVPFDEIDNADVPLEQSDYQAFIDDNQARFDKKEETRVIRYAVFDVTPTAQDTAALFAEIDTLIDEFISTPNDTLFVERNQGTFTGAYLTKDQLSPSVADTIDKMALGTVYGPYIQNGSYNATKLIDKLMIADSADTRHILINVNQQDPTSEFTVEKRIDSLMNLLATGQASWDSIAQKFSEDPGSKFNGGKYENITYGQFVPEFNQKLFIDGEIGELYKVRSQQFGWHIVEVLSRTRSGQERYQIAQINLPIVPSEDTQQDMYNVAQTFITSNKSIDDFTKSVTENPELSLESSAPLAENAYTVGTLGTGQSSRDIIRWAFSASKGSVSPEIYSFQDPVNFYFNKYVVAAMGNILPPGAPSVDQVQSDIELEVMNLKKGEKINEAIQGKDMSAIAAQYDITVDTARRVNFDQDNIPQLGPEPKIIAQTYTLSEGEISQPIVGSSGVYVIKIISKPDISGDPNIPQLRQQISSSTKSLISGRLIESLRNKARIEDNRSRFY